MIVYMQNERRKFGDKAWSSRFAEKLRFTFSETRLDQTLDALRSLNNDFRALSEQARESFRNSRKAPQAHSIKVNRDIKLYEIVGKMSQQVHQALGKACTKHTEHLAHFCIQVEHIVRDGRYPRQVKFNMAFTHVALTDSINTGNPVWFVVDSTMGDLLTPQVVESSLTFKNSLKRRIDHSDKPIPRKAAKSVRFQLSKTTCKPMPSSETITGAFSEASCTTRDFCDFLRQYMQQPITVDQCLGTLGATGAFRHRLFPSASRMRLPSLQPTSLRQLVSSGSKQGGLQTFLPYERICLAKTLATAVLQYHATPWLRTSLRSEDIFFFSVGDKEQIRPKWTEPHLNVKFRESNGQASRASIYPSHNLVRIQLLFSLGVILLEIAYSSTLESLQREVDLDNEGESQYTEFWLARRLARSGCTGMGPRYDKIIERLVECDFGCGSDLNTAQLQTALHNDVICPLEDVEQRLHSFHLDCGD